MRSAIIVTGVLGTGSALVFAAAALVSIMFPNGGTVAAGWNGGMMMKGGWIRPAVAVPAPMPVDLNGSPIPVNDVGVPVDGNGVPLK
jgi:hypothetical protein